MEEQAQKLNFFPHDLNASQNTKLIKLQIKLGIEGYGIYWRLVEYLHQLDIRVGEEDTIAYLLRTDVEKIKQVLNDFDLFEKKNDIYFSDRIQRNFEYVTGIKDKRSYSAKLRWLLSAFNTEFEKVFGEKPILGDVDIKNLKEWDKKVPELKNLLPKIFKDLKNLKFKDFPNFKPSANWLLDKNNLAKILNGEFVNEQEVKQAKKEQKAKVKELERQEEQAVTEEIDRLEEEVLMIDTKEEALKFLQKNCKNLNDLTSVFIPPYCKNLISKFKITSQELRTC